MVIFRLDIAFILTAVAISIAEAGDSCPVDTSFCSCTRSIRKQQPLPEYGNGNLLVKSMESATALRTRDSNSTVIECYLNDTDSSVLDTVASSFRRKLIDALIIHGLPKEEESPIARLPTEWLKNSRVLHFVITETVLSGDFISRENPLAGQERTLKRLEAVNCSLTGALTYDTLGTVNIKGLERFFRLERLDLSNNHLMIVEKNAFNYSHPRLETVILSKNAIQQVMPGAFHRLSKLCFVDLSHNMIQEISRDIFAPHPKFLKVIILSWNRLTNLENNLFSNMPVLRSIILNHNFLYALPEEPWKPIWLQLEEIDLHGNFIECTCELKWMFHNTNASIAPNQNRGVHGQCYLTDSNDLTKHLNLLTLSEDKLDCRYNKDKESDEDYTSDFKSSLVHDIIDLEEITNDTENIRGTTQKKQY